MFGEKSDLRTNMIKEKRKTNNVLIRKGNEISSVVSLIFLRCMVLHTFIHFLMMIYSVFFLNLRLYVISTLATCATNDKHYNTK